GARVVTFTLDQVDRIRGFVRDSFKVDEANSEDKQKLLRPSEFGYLSIHFVVQIVKPVFGIAVPEGIEDLKAEIQVRTLLQHAWAGIAHDILYKNEFEVPKGWSRQFNRLAAVLEGSDREFSHFIANLDRYTLNYGAFMDRDRRQEEIQTLRFLLEREGDLEQKE